MYHKGMLNIPRWRGKYFGINKVTIGGGLKAE